MHKFRCDTIVRLPCGAVCCTLLHVNPSFIQIKLLVGSTVEFVYILGVLVLRAISRPKSMKNRWDRILRWKYHCRVYSIRSSDICATQSFDGRYQFICIQQNCINFNLHGLYFSYYNIVATQKQWRYDFENKKKLLYSCCFDLCAMVKKKPMARFMFTFAHSINAVSGWASKSRFIGWLYDNQNIYNNWLCDPYFPVRMESNEHHTEKNQWCFVIYRCVHSRTLPYRSLRSWSHTSPLLLLFVFLNVSAIAFNWK